MVVSKSRGAKPRSWHFPTSPRSPKKLLRELEALLPFNGRIWNKNTQEEFSRILKRVDGYEGGSPTDGSDFAARDRVNRAPRLLGLVYTKPEGAGRDADRTLIFSDVGKKFIECDETSVWRIFREQLCKVRFGSPIHSTDTYANFCVSPVYVLFSVLREVGFLTKIEIALFILTTTDHTNIPSAIHNIKNFREMFGLSTPRGPKKSEYVNWIYAFLAEQVYAEDIAQGRTHKREGRGNFLETKFSNLRDYADATIRYFQAAEFIEFSASGRSIKLASDLEKDINWVLYNLRDVRPELHLDPKHYVLEEIGKPGTLELPSLKDTSKRDVVERLISEIPDPLVVEHLNRSLQGADNERLGFIYDEALVRQRLAQSRDRSREIHRRATALLPEISSFYQDLTARGNEVLDKPLFLEWNAWRTFSALNHHEEIVANLKFDAAGNPMSTAPGRMPDAVIHYENYVLVCEVTLSTGATQYKMEGEPVPRHVGYTQKELRDKGVSKPVYGLFLAPSISIDAALYFKTTAKEPVEHLGGYVRVLPVSIKLFQEYLGHSMAGRLTHPNTLLSIFEKGFEADMLTGDVSNWLTRIEHLIKNPPLLHYVS